MIHPGISLPEFTGYYFIITIPHSHALQTHEAGREREEVRMTQEMSFLSQNPGIFQLSTLFPFECQFLDDAKAKSTSCNCREHRVCVGSKVVGRISEQILWTKCSGRN
jgi:hypothetical protein